MFAQKLTFLPGTKYFHMISNYLLGLTSISQWGLFLGIASILFGLVEKREKFVIAGQVAFLLVGLMAIWILLTGQIYVPEITNGNIPKQIKVLAYFKTIIAFSGLTVVSLVLGLFKVRFRNAILYILMFVSLMLFFIVFNIQQLPN